MDPHVKEADAVWWACKTELEHRSMHGLGDLLGVSEKTIGRWKQKDAISGNKLEQVKNRLEAHGIDWGQYLDTGPVWPFESTNYWDAVDNGPVIQPGVVPSTPNCPSEFLGRTLGSPFGVGPSIATSNAHWIKSWSDLRFSVLTLKTVRLEDQRFQPHAAPHVQVVPEQKPWRVGEIPSEIIIPNNPEELENLKHRTLANSVGIPSLPTHNWVQEIKTIRDSLLADDEFLIVSVAGSGSTEKAMLDNFAECAATAAHAGADAVELNLSCPNIFVDTDHPNDGQIFHDANLTKRLANSVRRKFGDDALTTPVLLKLGWLGQEQLELLVNQTRGIVAGYTAINAIPTNVFREQQNGLDNLPAFSRPGADPRAGITGFAIRDYALDMIKRLGAMRKHPDEYVIVGIGGVTDAESVLALLDAGANVVQSCTAAMFNRLLAVNVRKALHKRQPSTLEAFANFDMDDYTVLKVMNEIHLAGRTLGKELLFIDVMDLMSEHAAELTRAQQSIRNTNPASGSRPRFQPLTAEQWREKIKNRNN